MYRVDALHIEGVAQRNVSMSSLRRIYLGNLPYHVTAQEVVDFLGLSGCADSVVELVCAKDKPHRRLGFGFVSVAAEDVERVLSCSGSQLSGRAIKVSMARQSDQSKPDKWQPAARRGPRASVMTTKTNRGIPQSVLDSLAALRLRLDQSRDGKSPEASASPSTAAAKQPTQPLLVDVGANLTNYRFRGQLESVIDRALAAGVHKIMVTGTSADGSQTALVLAQSLPEVLYCTAGLHPHHAKDWSSEVGDVLQTVLSAGDQVVAVGETGLDYNRMFSTIDQQKAAFTAQAELACKVQKPLFVHEREAYRDVVQILSKFQDQLPPVLIHCFTGTAAEASKYIELGYYIGITGLICKPERGRKVRELLKNKTIPLERLVLETDAPFMLPPLPSADYNGLQDRKGTNEPCTLPLVARQVAELCGVSLQEVALTTTATAASLFRL